MIIDKYQENEKTKMITFADSEKFKHPILSK
jgi:hypothetical protein